MKNYYVFILISLFIASSILGGCKKDDPASKAEINEKLLKSHPWNVHAVTVDGVDKTSSFAGLTLNFNASEVTATNGNVVWPASTTWSFTDNTATAFARGDGVEVTITSIDKSAITLALQWDATFGEGKMASIEGNYVFEFVK